MSTGYVHGAYGNLGESVVSNASTASTAPLIVGTAPVNLIRNYEKADIINNPVRLSNIGAKEIIGYSKDWNNFTLSEVLDAFFNNEKGNVGPIYVINVLNPDIHRKSEQTTKSLTFTNGTALIESDTIILDTFALDDKVEGVDYNLSYNMNTGKAVISSVDNSNKLKGTISASYYDVDTSLVTEENIIGKVSEEGVYTGLQAGKKLHPLMNVITNILLIPKWSEIPAVYEAMVEFSQKINGHWFAFPLADIPVKDGSNAVDTISKAKEWAKNNGYNSFYSKVFWPKTKTNSGKIFNLSSVAAVEMLRTDSSHDGVPMESCSNKTIPVAAQYFGDSSKNQGFDQDKANELNEVGITTLVAWGGTYVLWGPHTAGFEAGEDGNAKDDIDPLAIFDVNIRMQEYILNHFQEKWGSTVDAPLDINLRDTILEEEQQFLDSLVAIGALIGNPTVEFIESENSTSDIMNGNFKWNFSSTPTPPAKALKAEVTYTDAGFTTFFGEESEE